MVVSLENDTAKRLAVITDRLLEEIKAFKFRPPVAYVYNPLQYARKGYDTYIQRFATGPKNIAMIGMNPGPWGMVQTGIPFGEINSVKRWMNIHELLTEFPKMHPLRPIEGFECKKTEISGRRLWALAEKHFITAEKFFKDFIVLNYCPLAFVENSGRNRTPDKLPIKEKRPLFDACDRAIRNSIKLLKPNLVVAIGAFAEKRMMTALVDIDIPIGRITHPSPANPKANKGWANIVERELISIGVKLGC